jgi:hypothetical protein
VDILRVTAVGKDVINVVEEKFELVGLNTVNTVRNSMLGNLTALTYEFVIDEEEVISKRKQLMEEMAKDNRRLMPLYMHGDWMRIFVIKPMKC